MYDFSSKHSELFTLAIIHSFLKKFLEETGQNYCICEQGADFERFHNSQNKEDITNKSSRMFSPEIYCTPTFKINATH